MKEQQPEELETFELPEKEEKSKVINFASQADTDKTDKYVDNEATSTVNEDINHFDKISDLSAVNDSYKIDSVDNVNDFDKNNKQEQIKAQESPQAAIEAESDSLQSQEDEKSTVKKDIGEGEIPESLMKLISNARKKH